MSRFYLQLTSKAYTNISRAFERGHDSKGIGISKERRTNRPLSPFLPLNGFSAAFLGLLLFTWNFAIDLNVPILLYFSF